MPFLGTTGGGSVKQYGGQASLVYFIKNSLRFRESASAYLNRTFGTPTNNNTWTFSTWMKRGSVTSSGTPIFVVYVDGNNYTNFTIDSNQQMNFAIVTSGSARANSITSQVFRDPSAWYHVVLVANRAEATEANRIKMYINGVQVTAWATAPTWNNSYDSAINGNGQVHRIGNRSTAYFDGYLGEINFIDGQALTPSSFGKTDAVTGQWIPKKFASTYGTNGFYLKFADASAATAAAIGKDSSPNGNNWTPNNISVTAGATYDAMIDSPTLSAVASNYATLNPLALGTSQTSLTEGNLYAIPLTGASNWGTVFSSIAIPTSGKWYVEAVATVFAGSGNNSGLGVVDGSTFIPTNTTVLYNYTTGEGFDGILCHLFSDYVAPVSDGVVGTNVTGITGTSVNLMLALDVDNGKVYAGYNGTWLNSGNPAGNTGEVALRTFVANDVVAGHTSWGTTNNQSQYFNFGQRPFAYTPPSGFKSLNAYNLP